MLNHMSLQSPKVNSDKRAKRTFKLWGNFHFMFLNVTIGKSCVITLVLDWGGFLSQLANAMQ